MSRILHLVNMRLRYGRSKGVRAYRQEEPPLGNLAAPCHLEESASHHIEGVRLEINVNNQEIANLGRLHTKQHRMQPTERTSFL